MKLTQKRITNVITRILGSDGMDLYQLLKEKDNRSEFEIAELLDIDIKLVRRNLYKLYNNNLVSFTRKKDKTKGWYIYYWTLKKENIKHAYIKRLKAQLEKLEELRDNETGQLYYACPPTCDIGSVRLDFDSAMEYEFHCPECGILLNQEDTESRVAQLEKKIEEIKVELSK